MAVLPLSVAEIASITQAPPEQIYVLREPPFTLFKWNGQRLVVQGPVCTVETVEELHAFGARIHAALRPNMDFANVGLATYGYMGPDGDDWLLISATNADVTGLQQQLNALTDTVNALAASLAGIPTSRATTVADGWMANTDKIKLDSVHPNATQNADDAFLLARQNHTGTQPQSTVTNLVSDLAGKQRQITFGTNLTYDPGTGQLDAAAPGTTVALNISSGDITARTMNGNGTEATYAQSGRTWVWEYETEVTTGEPRVKKRTSNDGYVVNYVYANPAFPLVHTSLTGSGVDVGGLAADISTWADRGTGVYVGQQKRISDRGLAPGLIHTWDGTNWVPEVGTYVIQRAIGGTPVVVDLLAEGLHLPVFGTVSPASGCVISVEESLDNGATWSSAINYGVTSDLKVIQAGDMAAPTHLRFTRVSGASSFSLVTLQTGAGIGAPPSGYIPASSWAARGTGMFVGQQRRITDRGDAPGLLHVWDGTGWVPEVPNNSTAGTIGASAVVIDLATLGLFLPVYGFVRPASGCTITLEESLDGGSTWQPAKTYTVPAEFTVINDGAEVTHLRFTRTAGSSTASAYVLQTGLGAGSTTVVGGGTGGVSAAGTVGVTPVVVSLAEFGPLIHGVLSPDTGCVLSLEQSTDSGATWSTPLSISTETAVYTTRAPGQPAPTHIRVSRTSGAVDTSRYAFV